MSRSIRRTVALLLVVVVIFGACGGDDVDVDDVVAEEELAAEEEFSVENEPVEEPLVGDEPASSGAVARAARGLEVSGVTFDNGKVLIINTGAEPVDLTGLWLCNRPDYAALPPFELGPSEGFEFEFPGVGATGGEAAIFVSDNFDRSEDMISYVHWGTGGGRAQQAIDAGLWEGRPVEVTGPAIFLIDDPGAAAGWEE